LSKLKFRVLEVNIDYTFIARTHQLETLQETMHAYLRMSYLVLII